VKGPFTAGDSVGVNGSGDYAEVGGERSLSRLLASYEGTDTVLAPVQLGAGGGYTAAVHRLQIVNTSVAAVVDPPEAAVAKYRVRLGKVGDAVADPTMTDPGDDPIFEKTIIGAVEGWYVIYSKHAMSYIGNGQWEAAYGTIYTGDVDEPLPANDHDWFYVEIGQVRVGDEGVIDAVAQTAPGDMGIAREGGATVFRERLYQVLAF
jgi:hypothetical protein